jgi:hypothetical protein
MVWDPSRITPATWPNVLAFYRHIEERNDDFRPLGELVEHLMTQPYASALYGATSGTSMLVARRPDGDWARDALRVDVDLAGSIRFVHYDPTATKPRSIPNEDVPAVRTFEAFLRRAGWIDAGPAKAR